MRKMLKEKYGMKVASEQELMVFTPFELQDNVYTIFDASGLKDDVLKELYIFSTHLYQSGDRHVSSFVPSNEGTLIVTWDNKSYCLLVNFRSASQKGKKIGRKLAKFHFRGRTITESIKTVNRVGHWKQLWEQRLEQMEKVWNRRIFQIPENDFERMFFESFPYYMGCTENAIQYLVDTEIDDEPRHIDSGTVCHERFSNKSWGDIYYIKNPFDWVFDHCSRDLAEWTRECYFQNKQTYRPLMQKFFHQYQTVEQLSSFSWRLLYSRILFPLHYFECIERYYLATSEHEKNVQMENLAMMLKQTVDYERFLKEFYQLIEVPVRAYNIPVIDWLSS